MRLVFLGSPPDAVPALRALHDRGHEIALVVTQPDRRRQRGTALVPTPVKVAAEELGVPVRTPHRSREIIDDVAATGAELGVVVAFGQLLPPALLAAVPLGFVNVHFSLLPRWRGAAPVERAILAGDDRTGVCLMEVEEGLDTGGVYRRAEVAIGPDETADELRARLVDAAVPLLLDALEDGLGMPEPQKGEATYADKIDPAEREIDWTRPAVGVHRLVRIGDAWTTFRGKRLKVWRTALVATGAGVTVPAGDGPIEVLEVQPEGKPRMAARAWANGAHVTEVDRLPS